MSRKRATAETDSPEKELEKRDNFTRLASSRVRRACKDIRAIAPLANKSSYIFTEEDVGKIREYLGTAIDETMAVFEGNGKAESLFGS